MSPLLLALAYVASALPLAVDLDLAGGGAGLRLSLALLPWLALAGVPRGDRPHLPAGAAVAGALPPLALAAHLDLEAGFPRGEVLAVGGAGFALLALLAAAAELARARRCRWHGVLWIALVAGVPALALALSLGAADPSPWLARVAAASPPVWALEARGSTAFGPLAVAAGLLLVAARRGERAT